MKQFEVTVVIKVQADNSLQAEQIVTDLVDKPDIIDLYIDLVEPLGK